MVTLWARSLGASGCAAGRAARLLVLTGDETGGFDKPASRAVQRQQEQILYSVWPTVGENMRFPQRGDPGEYRLKPAERDPGEYTISGIGNLQAGREEMGYSWARLEIRRKARDGRMGRSSAS
jgi:hypothetical protein